ncbi:Cell wall protein PRY3 [Tetrabaena socialis]|uniref:Cell wall protein PRY3 n=1 Tax=Tetrabaena socialis TaxID=47790 RepID=A0A2J8AEL3_9CHLO|nr:Cell wall protein PRY3 [Tetrabaena socialis]|eukprot:PNH10965.1 Cell wall protein PRY3 [Tetrabaena socialis]
MSACRCRIIYAVATSTITTTTTTTTAATAFNAFAKVTIAVTATATNTSTRATTFTLAAHYPKPNLSCKGAIDAWYGEWRNYNFTVPNPFDYNWPRNIGHFSQLVWRSSGFLGCGMSTADVPMRSMPGGFGGCKVVVCRMKAPGNVAVNSYFRSNVLPRVQ